VYFSVSISDEMPGPWRLRELLMREEGIRCFNLR
jgi:hypothetical protein